MKLRTRLGLAGSGFVLASVLVALVASSIVTERGVRAGMERELLDRAREAAAGRGPGAGGPPRGPGGFGGPFGPGSKEPGSPPGDDSSASGPGEGRTERTIARPGGPSRGGGGGGFPPPRRGGPRFNDGLGPRHLWENEPPYDAAAVANASSEPRLTLVESDELGRLRVVTVRTPQGVMQDARSLEGLDRVLAQQRATILALGLPLAALAGLAGFGLAALFLRPVATMTQAAERLRLDHEQEPLAEGDDEIGRLGAALNAMAARSRRAYAEVAASLELQKRFTGDAAHELRTPLARIKMATSGALAQARGEEEMKAALAQADAEADRMARLVRALLLLARVEGGAGEARAFDLREAAPPDVEARLPETAVPVRADPDLIGRAVANLAENARRHTPEGTPVWVEMTAEGGWAVARVVDKGPGIPREHLPNLGRRFYRPDAARAGDGTGLGLSIARTVAERFGGTLELASSAQGTVATLRLPLQQ